MEKKSFLCDPLLAKNTYFVVITFLACFAAVFFVVKNGFVGDHTFLGKNNLEFFFLFLASRRGLLSLTFNKS